MLNIEIKSVVDNLMPLFCQFSELDFGIAVGGAHAKGTADEESDLDVYVFAKSILPNEKRTQLTANFSNRIKQVVSWGSDSHFVQAGTDFVYDQRKLECWLRSSDYVDVTISDCVNGVVRRDIVTWTPTCFYNHCALSDINTMIIIKDPSGMLSNWKSAISKYPPKLQEKIIQLHLGGARFWPANFHYNSAIERQDVIYTTSIIQQVIHNLIQTLFAVNEVYFPGDKKLDKALARLDRLPDLFPERICRLVSSEKKVSVKMLKEQQYELQQLLKDTEIIAAEVIHT